MASVAKGNTMRQRSTITRARDILDSPYETAWPKLEGGQNEKFLNEIKAVFGPLKIQLRKRRKKKAENVDVVLSDEKQKEINKYKALLVVGINEVTKALEKGLLQLVLVCRSAKPVILTSHLMNLSATRSTPACAISNLSDTLAPLVGLWSVMACGFKKSDFPTEFDDLIEFISVQAPPIHPPWLSSWKATNASTTHKSMQQNVTNNSIKMEAENIIDRSLENLTDDVDKNKECLHSNKNLNGANLSSASVSTDIGTVGNGQGNVQLKGKKRQRAESEKKVQCNSVYVPTCVKVYQPDSQKAKEKNMKKKRKTETV